jgi:hypothetical protein
MGKKPNKLRPDAAETAYRVMLEATGQAEKTPPPDERTEKDPEAVARGSKGGKKGGLKGGRARAASLTAEEREAAAQIAALARWKKQAY